MKLLLAFIFSFGILNSYSQEQPSGEYISLVQNATDLLKQGKHQEAINTYQKAFQLRGGKGDINSLYNVACAWSLLNQKDSAFTYLERAVIKGKYSDYTNMVNDQDLMGLHQDARWSKLIEVAQQNKVSSDQKMNVPVKELLEKIFKDDQDIRKEVMSVMKSKGQQSPELKDLQQKMQISDSINLSKVTQILDKYGWLGPDEVGVLGSSALFLVIQHAPFTVQQKYVDVMRKAASEGKLQKSHLATLEDRILVFQGKKQIYGTQLKTEPSGKSTLFPIEDEANVDVRRAQVGLTPLKEYLKHFDIDYSPVSK